MNLLGRNSITIFMIIAAIIITFGTTPLIKSDLVFAASSGGGYQSGYDHGVEDANNNSHWYILEPGKGFQFHTPEFIRGYVTGFCSIAGSHFSSDSNKAFFSCEKGPGSAGWIPR
ncbi:MAG: hypothetical protein WBP64_16715 [Nitrososphaeraceae archaeon]